jgi:hypothetical protein
MSNSSHLNHLRLTVAKLPKGIAVWTEGEELKIVNWGI